MVIIALLPLTAFVFIFISVFFYEQIKKENYFEDMYKKYGALIKVNVSSSKYIPFSGRDTNNYHFNVSFTDDHGKEHRCTISTNNKNAKKYLESKEMEVFCLLPIFENYSSIYEFITQTYSTQKEIRKHLYLCSVPLMVIKDDREFKKRGNTHRYKVICLTLFIILLIFILTYRI